MNAKKIVWYIVALGTMGSCSEKFYDKDSVGSVMVQIKAFAAEDKKIYVSDRDIGKIDSVGKIWDRAGKCIGQSQYPLLTNGNIKIRINLIAVTDGSLQTYDSLKVGKMVYNGKVYSISGHEIGKRIASKKELFEYFEKNRDYYQENF